MRRRLAAAVALALAVPAALPANGAQPHVTDPRGDWPVAAQDIVSATFATREADGRSRLEIRLELAGAPLPDAALYWEVGWSTPDCALTYIEYSRSAYWPGEEEAALIRQCRPGGDYVVGHGATGRLEGSTIVLTVPLGRRLRTGTVLTEPYAGSWTFVLVHGSVPTWAKADETAKGRPYRVGTR